MSNEQPTAALPAEDVEPAPPRRRSLFRRIRHRVRPLVSRPLVAFALFVVPRLFHAYMWIVWKTSKIEDHGISLVPAVRDEHDGVVCMVWHEEALLAAWDYGRFGAHSLIGAGDAGEMMTRIIVPRGYTVFRGGSTKRRSRRRENVLQDMIDHVKGHARVALGNMVDGSTGPPHEVKRGTIIIARECKKPLLLVRTWAKRNVRLPTWDRTAIPLPFNRIRQFARGPFFVPEGTEDPAVLEAFRLKMEENLNALARDSEEWAG